jgi:hypothetical protein
LLEQELKDVVGFFKEQSEYLVQQFIEQLTPVFRGRLPLLASENDKTIKHQNAKAKSAIAKVESVNNRLQIDLEMVKSIHFVACSNSQNYFYKQVL